ncbi:nuclear pore protein 84/107 [Xylaria sp. CBS 124048]|nr:nuclear pore protein 84/107 [Xylaria sp. CBS 124048]
MLALRPPQLFGVEYDRPDEDDMSQESETASSKFIEAADRFAKALDTLSLTHKDPAEQRADIFKLVETYHQYATSNAQTMRQAQKSTSGTDLQRLDDSSSQDSMDLDDADNEPSVPDFTDEVRRWEQEAQIWDMLRRLLPLRYSTRNTLKSTRRDFSKYQTSAGLWDELLQSDVTAQEHKAILECLQTSAHETRIDIDDLVRDYQQQAERGDIIAYGWLHTRSAIKVQKNVNSWTGPLDPNSADAGQLVDGNGTNPLVTQLDPDVTTRQARKLEPQDEYFERAIWLGCFELLRRGRSLNEIRDWCVERTEVWRAVSMSAMPLSKGEEAKGSSTDPLSTLLWRRTCFALARQGGTDDYERAVYGILSGDIPSVEKVCKGWDDFVFAHYNALLRAQFDGYIMKRTSPDSTATIHQTFPSFNALQFLGDVSSASERLVSSLESNPKTSVEAKTPWKALQAAIISNSLPQYLHDLGVFLGKRANQKGVSDLIKDINDATVSVNDPRYFMIDDHEGLRVATHVYLLISHLDRLQGVDDSDSSFRSAQDNIVATYVSILRLANLTELMPLYCSNLEEHRSFFTLSRNIVRVKSAAERRTLIKIMTKLGMDTAKFVNYQPHSILSLDPKALGQTVLALDGTFTVLLDYPPTLKYGRLLKPDFFGDDPDKMANVDEFLIHSLEWYFLVDGLWEEFFLAGTATYKHFLAGLNLNAARRLSERVRCAEIFRQKARVTIVDDSNITWFEEVRLGRLSTSIGGKEMTLQQLSAARSFFEMECLVRALDSMETIASSESLILDPTEGEGDFGQVVAAEVNNLKQFMAPVLDKWLLTCLRENEDFTHLRDIYLPEMIIGYVSVLHFAGTFLDRDHLLLCMDLASLIAKKDADVAMVLMKAGRMREIVDSFARCSKALAISSPEKKSLGGSNKKLRELGWSRELWTVKQ